MAYEVVRRERDREQVGVVVLAEALADLAAAARDGLIEKLAVERLDGETVIGSWMETALIEAGFRRQPRRLVA